MHIDELQRIAKDKKDIDQMETLVYELSLRKDGDAPGYCIAKSGAYGMYPYLWIKGPVLKALIDGINAEIARMKDEIKSRGVEF